MLEIACFNAASAVTAAKAGADRIELCADYAAGGVTPSLSTLHSIRKATDKPIHVMIRPRGGDFTYSAAQCSQMKSNIDMFKESSAVDGFVFGILTAGNEIDQARNRELVEAAKPLPCTFHRAIDDVTDLDAAVETIVDCGFASILTSGGAKNAWEGRARVGELQQKYSGRISIILGGGIRSTNVVDLKHETGVQWVHSAAITGPDEEVDSEEVGKMVELLRNA
ncbi:putative copper homeostasis protein [Didymella exigua CBS 183.55]|uniref:Copper homeostasis protein cutC homolog n=1 Tax=Didymella exigua CBS 183.55 TaxID=1150837 RepID=A0A6A5RWD7_9PLEO|nr:putative copper homeostasis protein [Didymella exigua CBS 183.55]KAF1931504.1 putative copper homeostasis protein [Didymella exigua CBS 183.55]